MISVERTRPNVVAAARVAELFQAMGDPSRVRILLTLLRGEVNVGTIAERVGISESAVSHHLRGLRQLRIVAARKTGRSVFYSLDDDHVAALLTKGLEHVEHSNSEFGIRNSE